MTVWRKSTYSMETSCLEVAVWRKSTYSAESYCVEAASTDDRILVRDSKDPSGPVLSFTPDEWFAFIEGVKVGEFDDL